MKWIVSDCSPGDMIRIRVGAIWHYGVFCSDDEVIEFGEAPLAGLNRDASKIQVMRVGIDEFACGKLVEVASLDRSELRRRIAPKKTVEIARSRIGEGGYDILKNNCEHFANECVFGKHICSMEEEAREKWRERPALDVYAADLSETLPALPGFPQKQLIRLIKKKSPEEQEKELFLWNLLAYAASKSFAYEPKEWKIKKDQQGFFGADRFCFSFCMAGSTAFVAISHSPVVIRAKEIPAGEKSDFYCSVEKDALAEYRHALPGADYYTFSGIYEGKTPSYLAVIGESARMALVWHYDTESGRTLRKLAPAEKAISL